MKEADVSFSSACIEATTSIYCSACDADMVN